MDPAQTAQNQPPPAPSAPTQTPATPSALPVQKKLPTILGRRIVEIIGAIVIFLTLVVAILISSTVYTNVKIPLLSTHKKDLTLLFYKIPFVPKNPEQILITAVDKNTRLKTYTPDFSLSAQLKTTDVELGSIDLQVKGPVDITDEKNIAFSIDGTAAVNYGGHSYEVSGKLIEKGKALYAKIDKLPNEVIGMYSAMSLGTTQQKTPQAEIQKNFEELFKNWIKYEFKSLPTKAREELEKNIKNTSITNQIREESQNFLLKSSILPEVKKLKDEKIDGVDSYHLLLDPPKEKVKQIILDYVAQNESLQKKEYKQATDAIASSFEQLHMEIWVGKSDAIVRKTSIQTQIDLGFIQKMLYPGVTSPTGTGIYSPKTASTLPPPNYFGLGDLGKAKLDFSSVVILNDVNKPVTITLPEKTITIEEYYKLFQDAFLTKAARETKAKQDQQTSDLTEIGKALTLYFVDTTNYPSSLSELVGKYIQTSSPLVGKLGTFNYRRGTNSTKFVLYVLGMGIYDSTYATPYFGITNVYSYPHQLTVTEFAQNNQ